MQLIMRYDALIILFRTSVYKVLLNYIVSYMQYVDCYLYIASLGTLIISYLDNRKILPRSTLQ